MQSMVCDWDEIAVIPTPIGAVRKFFEMPTALLPEIECHATTLNPGMSPHPPHQHVAEEMIIIKEGMLEAVVEGQTIQLRTGAVLFVASNELHGWTNVSDTPATYYVIQLRAAEV